jgi:hypothetical protein
MTIEYASPLGKMQARYPEPSAETTVPSASATDNVTPLERLPACHGWVQAVDTAADAGADTPVTRTPPIRTESATLASFMGGVYFRVARVVPLLLRTMYT